jgi:hypothetical protein
MDTLCHEYGWSLKVVMDRTPLAIAFALYAAVSARYEASPAGPSYAEQDMLAALRNASASRDGDLP